MTHWYQRIAGFMLLQAFTSVVLGYLPLLFSRWKQTFGWLNGWWLTLHSQTAGGESATRVTERDRSSDWSDSGPPPASDCRLRGEDLRSTRSSSSKDLSVCHVSTKHQISGAVSVGLGPPAIGRMLNVIFCACVPAWTIFSFRSLLFVSD